MARPARPATTNGCKATETSGGADKAEGAPIATNKTPARSTGWQWPVTLALLQDQEVKPTRSKQIR